MNSLQAKQLSLPEIMSRLGYEPVKVIKQGRELWYKSPFREESEASFHTSYLGGKWIWNDFGDIGGTVIDFVMRHENCKSVKDTLAFLDGMFRGVHSGAQARRTVNSPADQHSLFSFQQQNLSRGEGATFEKDADRDLEFIKDSPLQSPLIFSYLEGRRIPRELAEKYLRLIHYRNKKKPSEKPYFAFGMQNRSGGYEIRSASDEPKLKFKSALIVRDITIVEGRQGRGTVNVFEGQLDFLSLLAMLRTDQLSGDSIILNGLKSYALAKTYIEEQGYTAINTFLDNNDSGQETTQDFIRDFGAIVSDYSPSFLPHVDLNDALRADDIPSFSSQPSPPSP